MKIIIFLFLLCINNLYAQDFESYNVNIQKIGIDVFSDSYKKRNKYTLLKRKSRGKKTNTIFEHFLGTSTGEMLHELWGDDILMYMSYYSIPHNEHMKIIEVDTPVKTRSYILYDNASVDTLELLGGCITKDGVLFAYDNFGDETILCRWYSIKNSKISQIAELKEITYTFHIPELDDMPSFFYGVDGCYYLRIKRKGMDVFQYYKIAIEN